MQISRKNYVVFSTINHFTLLHSYQSNMAKEVLDTILNIQPKDSSAGTGDTRENTVYRIANDMLKKLPPDYVPHEVRVFLMYVCITNVHTLYCHQGQGKTSKDGSFVIHEYIFASRN